MSVHSARQGCSCAASEASAFGIEVKIRTSITRNGNLPYILLQKGTPSK